jgi:aspartate ammonia-lyase
MVKKACFLTNRELGYIEREKADVIEFACDEIIEGNLSDTFCGCSSGRGRNFHQYK